jgi:hypothetical protein
MFNPNFSKPNEQDSHNRKLVSWFAYCCLRWNVLVDVYQVLKQSLVSRLIIKTYTKEEDSGSASCEDTSILSLTGTPTYDMPQQIKQPFVLCDSHLMPRVYTSGQGECKIRSLQMTRVPCSQAVFFTSCKLTYGNRKSLRGTKGWMAIKGNY